MPSMMAKKPQNNKDTVKPYINNVIKNKTREARKSLRSYPRHDTSNIEEQTISPQTENLCKILKS